MSPAAGGSGAGRGGRPAGAEERTTKIKKLYQQAGYEVMQISRAEKARKPPRAPLTGAGGKGVDLYRAL